MACDIPTIEALKVKFGKVDKKDLIGLIDLWIGKLDDMSNNPDLNAKEQLSFESAITTLLMFKGVDPLPELENENRKN